MSYWYDSDTPQPIVPAEQRRAGPPVTDDFIRDVGVAAEAYAASRDLGLYVDNTVGRANAIEEAYDRRIDAVFKATGVRLENPVRLATPPGEWIAQARELGLQHETGPAAARQALIGRAEDAFADRLRELSDSLPDLSRGARAAIAADRPIIDDARQIGRDAYARAQRANAAATSRPYTRFIAGAAGGMEAGFRDPLNVGLAAATAPIGGSGTGAWMVLRNIVTDAVVNAAGETALQPAIMQWRRELGLPAGWREAAENVGTAAAFGGGVRAGIEAFGAFRPRAPGSPAPAAESPPAAPQSVTPEIENPAPRPPPPAGSTISDAINGDDDALIRAAREGADELDPAALAAAEALEADRLVRGMTPEGMAPTEHTRNYAQAVRFAEEPEAELPALPFDPVPARREDAPPLPDATPGQRFEYLKKPVTFETIDAASLDTDAATFQYKGGGDAGGVTGRLLSVTRWDNLASGKVVVFERANGERVIADGHQRLGLARRLLAEGREPKIELNGFVFREADGWTPADVRAIAAKKNLQEGSGDVVDTARVLRERPTILDGSVATGSEHMRQARGLARLSDEAFGMVVNGRLAPNHAAVVGELIADKSMHAPALELLSQVDDLTATRARFMVADMARAPSTREVQETLLGVLERTVPLVAERARVLDKAIGALRREKSAFRTVLASRQALEGAGNVIEESGSREAIDAAGEAIAAIEKLALRAGPISAALDRAAQELADGARIGNATDAFVREVTDLVDQRGLIALATEPEAPPARVVFDDPVGAEADAQADALFGDLFGAPEGRMVALEQKAQTENTAARRPIESVQELIAGQPHQDLDGLFAVAPRLQEQLAGTGERVAADTGTEWQNPGIKKRETAETKMSRKGYRTPAQMTDVIRGGFLVDTPDQADAVARQLGTVFDVLDEGWTQTPAGYVDRKVLVRFEDGTVGEIQIWSRRMYEAKKVGSKLYQKWRALDPISDAAVELVERQRALYSAAARADGEVWSAAIASGGKGGSSPKVVENAERNAASDGSTEPLSTTSAGWTADQPSPGASTAQAPRYVDGNTAGRASQLTNSMGDTSELNVGGTRPEGNDTLAGVPRADDPDGLTATPATERDLLDDVTHAEDTALGLKQCATGNTTDG